MNIKSIIGIVSCKGGVGKSTFAVNIAVALANFYNMKIGLLDADIYGPNHSRLLGVSESDFLKMNISDKSFLPVLKHGVYSMSFGYFLNVESAVLLRGPIISNTIKYLFNSTKWGNLDILVVDFPPGTGDIYLSLLRDISFSGVVLVTIPQMVSVDDVRKSILMLKKFNIHIYCLIENMKYLLCENCNHLNYFHGVNSFGLNLAKEFNIFNFYELRLDKFIGERSNNGVPFILDVNVPFDVKKVFLNICNFLL